ncbi:MAG: bifunctional demethylmenaquinone methyltransferase/2-methoxy-6-polyprenyl-1,4-benzoquinol methylase UbiE [Bacteroidales bacterium]|nr:bifunctional demethylmenaquinone methyltransferase/2-methoxy-6-polyprenyl-1,4-benzoquinol methylase UbiE [Bacteroidales bacterium]
MYNNKKKREVGQMFDKIAPTYDLLNHILSFNRDKQWRKYAVSVALKNNPNRILDIATGTGDMIGEIRKFTNIPIDAIDISDNMMEIAKKKLSNYSDINFYNMPAEKLNFSDNYFDTVMVAFGIRNFEDLHSVLGEVYRVLTLNGQFVVLEFFRPENPVLFFVMKLYLKYILPVIGGVISKNKAAYKYLYRSIENFYTIEDFALILKMIGFEKISVKIFNLGLVAVFVVQK